MTDNIKDAILALQNGDSSKFKDVINTELMNKAMDAINLQKIHAGQSFFNEPEEMQDDSDNAYDLDNPEEEPNEEI